MPMMVSVSGIRGIVGEDLTPPAIMAYVGGFAHVLQIASGIGKFKKGNRPAVLTGRDTRPSGEFIQRIAEGTLNALGFDTIDIGIATTPTVLLATRKMHCTGGIAVTASHNPSQWNALKLCDEKGLFLTGESIARIKQYASEQPVVQWPDYTRIGQTRRENAASLHIQEVLSRLDTSAIRKMKFRVAIDPVGATGSLIDREFLGALGCSVVGVNDHPEPEFPRRPEPVPENLVSLKKLVKDENADIGFAQDPDGDRLAIVTDTGEAVGEEYTLVLAGEAFLRKKKTDIVCNLSTSMMIDRLAERYGVDVIRTKIGEINVTLEMLERGAAYGGEGNGGVIVPEINPCRDSIVGMGLILELLAHEKCVSKIIESLPHFHMKKDRATVPQMERETLYGRLREYGSRYFHNYLFSELDGIKYYNNSEWLHIRASNTEPIVRIMAESESEHRTEQLIEIGRSCIESLQPS